MITELMMKRSYITLKDQTTEILDFSTTIFSHICFIMYSTNAAFIFSNDSSSVKSFYAGFEVAEIHEIMNTTYPRSTNSNTKTENHNKNSKKLQHFSFSLLIYNKSQQHFK